MVCAISLLLVAVAYCANSPATKKILNHINTFSTEVMFPSQFVCLFSLLVSTWYASGENPIHLGEG